MYTSMSAPPATAALLVALVGGHDFAHAAPNDCLSAPNGAASKGQHWYYHLDRAANRKCWYLRDIGTAAATPSAAAASQQADNPAPAQPAAAPSSSPPAAASAAAAFGGAEARAPSAAATPVDAQAAVPPPPAATSGAAKVWSDPSPPAAPVANTAVVPSQPAHADVADPPVRRAPAKKRATAAPATQPDAAAPVSDKATTSVAQNVLVMLLAALLAGAVFAVFAVLRRRKPVTIRAAGSGPRFGSRPERNDGLWLKWPRRGDDAPSAAPIQKSLIPQQVSVTRQSAPRG
jgi:hypothetical protein